MEMKEKANPIIGLMSVRTKIDAAVKRGVYGLHITIPKISQRDSSNPGANQAP